MKRLGFISVSYTHLSHAATKDDLYYQARHVQIAHDDETLTELYDGCYIQSEAEIYEVMSSQIGEENVKLGLASTNKVADMIENVDMPFQAPQLPTYPLPDGFEDNLSYLKHLTAVSYTHLDVKFHCKLDFWLCLHTCAP